MLFFLVYHTVQALEILLRVLITVLIVLFRSRFSHSTGRGLVTFSFGEVSPFTLCSTSHFTPNSCSTSSLKATTMACSSKFTAMERSGSACFSFLPWQSLLVCVTTLLKMNCIHHSATLSGDKRLTRDSKPVSVPWKNLSLGWFVGEALSVPVMPLPTRKDLAKLSCHLQRFLEKNYVKEQQVKINVITVLTRWNILLCWVY